MFDGGRLVAANTFARELGFSTDRPEEISEEILRFAQRSSEEALPITSETLALEIRGKLQHFHAAAKPVEASSVSRVIVILTDISRHYDMSEELGDVVIEAELANRKLAEQNILSKAIASFGQRLLRAGGEEQVIDHLVQALKESRITNQPPVYHAFDGKSSLVDNDIAAAKDALIEQEANTPIIGEKDIFLPVRTRRKLMGTLHVYCRDHGGDTEEIRRALESFSLLTSFALENLLLYRDLNFSLRDLAFRNKAAQKLQHALSPEEVEQILHDLISTNLPLSWFGIILRNHHSNYVRDLAEPVRQAFRGHQTIARFSDGIRFAIPVRLKGLGSELETAVYAVIAGISPDPNALEDSKFPLFLAIIDLAANTLRNARLYHEVRTHSVATQFLNEELTRTINDLRAANEAKSRFVSTVSHEFRTPLTSILSYVDTLLKEHNNLDRQTTIDFLSVVKEESERLTRLINQVLDLSRIQSKDTPLKSETVDMNLIAHRVKSTLAPVAEVKKIEINLSSETDDLRIIGDKDAVTRVLLNIASNAVQYTQAGGLVKMNLSADRRYVYIRIIDTGIGIPEDKLEAIFGEFFTVDEAESEKMRRSAQDRQGAEFSGTGLGLSIAQAIVERHNGRISVHSELKSGTEFEIRLPREGETRG